MLCVCVLMALLGMVALAALLISNLSQAVAMPLIALANAINWLLVHAVDLFSPFGGASFRFAGILRLVSGGLVSSTICRWWP